MSLPGSACADMVGQGRWVGTPKGEIAQPCLDLAVKIP